MINRHGQINAKDDVGLFQTSTVLDKQHHAVILHLELGNDASKCEATALAQIASIEGESVIADILRHDIEMLCECIVSKGNRLVLLELHRHTLASKLALQGDVLSISFGLLLRLPC